MFIIIIDDIDHSRISKKSINFFDKFSFMYPNQQLIWIHAQIRMIRVHARHSDFHYKPHPSTALTGNRSQQIANQQDD